MDLQKKFQNVSSTRLIPASSLTVNKRYPILRAERAETRYGPTVMLTLQEAETSNIKICLPKRYAEVFTDENIAEINSGQLNKLNLVSKGQGPTSHSLVLFMEERDT
jgi:hypothetical protein